MISSRWTTTNGRWRVSRPKPETPEAPKRVRVWFNEPRVILGAALLTGVAIGILVKWGWRR